MLDLNNIKFAMIYYKLKYKFNSKKNTLDIFYYTDKVCKNVYNIYIIWIYYIHMFDISDLFFGNKLNYTGIYLAVFKFSI
jgi:hypothetical protein